MAIINLRKMEVECKIVYYGPGRCGKTTNLEYIFKNSKRFMTDEMVSVETKGDKTLFFDFAPMGIGKIKGCDVRVHLYTVDNKKSDSKKSAAQALTEMANNGSLYQDRVGGYLGLDGKMYESYIAWYKGEAPIE